MADEDDRLARGAELTEVLEEILRLDRRQDRRRLVEDQGLHASVERFQDLDPLLLTDGEVLDERARIDLEAVRVGELTDLRLGGAAVQDRTILVAEDDVLGHRERVHQDEVLVDHADPECDGRARARDLGFLPADDDASAVRRIHPVEDAHQRRLAGSVLTDQRVDLSGPELQRDVVVREHTGEALRDVLEDDEGRGAAAPRPAVVDHRVLFLVPYLRFRGNDDVAVDDLLLVRVELLVDVRRHLLGVRL